MKKIYLLLFTVLFATFLQAQTTLIPTGDGSFENGATFPSNGWSVSNSANNPWVVGGAISTPPFAGSSAYISIDGGATNSYVITDNSTNFFWRDITVPAGETKITLSFNWAQQGESSYDIWQVFTAPTTVTPVGSATHPGSGTFNVPPSIAGATFIGNGAPATGVQTAILTLPSSLAGTTFRLIFSWKSDVAFGSQPPAGIDNIILTSTVPSTITSTSIGGLFSSPATWIGGSVPIAGDDAVIADGAIVTVDQLVTLRDLVVGVGTSGILQWNATANTLTATRNVMVNNGANLNMFTAAASHPGVQINVGGNFTNNGTMHAAMAAAILNFNNTTSSSPATLDGSGTFVGGIIGQLLNSGIGGLNINTNQNFTTRAILHTAGPLNTNGKLSLDNTATIFGGRFTQKIYNIAVTAMGTGYNTATPPTIIISNPNTGITATASPNIDNATGTLRSIRILNPGDGYSSNPTVTISGGTGSGATAVAVNNRYSSGLASSSIQKSGVATITGGINIRSEQAVGALASSTALGAGYTSPPSIGFALPFGYQNLVTSGGSGYTSAPAITVSGGTFLTGATNPTFTVVVAQGQIVSVIAATGGNSWTTPPTLTVTGGGGSGATAAYPANCLATATASITFGAVSGYTITTGGFGYTAAPAVNLVGGGFTSPAAAFSTVPLYNLTLNYFAPAPVNAPHTETGIMPANRRINILSVTNAVSGSAFTGDVEIYAAAPLTLSASILSFGSNTLFASHPAYAGLVSSLTNNISGNIKLSTPGGSLTRYFPYDAPFYVNTGTGSLATGSTVTTIMVSRTGAPTGIVDNGSAPIGTRAYQVVTNTGAIYGTTPTVTLSYNSNDALFSNASQFYIAQATSLAGPWTVRSIPTGGGTLPATGNRTTAITAPGPIVPTGNDFFAFTTSTPQPVTSVMSGNWNAGTTWNTGVVPACNNNVFINNTHLVSVTTSGNVSNNVTINAGGTLSVSGGNLTIGCTLNNKILTNNGTLTVSGGTLNVNGNIALNDANTFNMSGGTIIIDPNDGTTAGSVASGTNILAIGATTAAMTSNVTGGNILFNDPPFAGNGYSLVNNTGTNMTWAGNTIQFGGTSNTNTTTATNGFRVNCYLSSGRISLGNVIVNGNDPAKPVTDIPSGINVANDLTINTGSELKITTALSSFAGNITNNGTLTSTATLSLQLINGLSNIPVSSNVSQTIGGTGVYRNLAASPTAEVSGLAVRNSSAAGVTLAVPLRISSSLTMTAGIIRTDAVNLLTLGYNAGNTGSMSYTAGNIVGPFKRWISAVTGARQFPTGTGAFLKNADINFTTAPASGGSLTARWSATPPAAPQPALSEGSLTVDQVSVQGSWFIDAADGLAGGTYTGTFTPNGSFDIVDYTKTVLIKRPSAGGTWTLDGTHVSTTGSNTAPVLQRTGMTGFSEFAIGGQVGTVVPVTIDYFRGSKLGRANYLDWKVNCTGEPSVRLILERSADGRNFISIQDQNVTAARCAQGFNYTDAAPLTGINYYRLKTISPDGAFRYSVIVALINKDKGFELISVAPNPVKTTTLLSISCVKAGKMSITVSDMTGKIVMTQNVNVIAGNNPIPMNFATLGAGIYNIKVINADNEIKTTRFVKY